MFNKAKNRNLVINDYKMNVKANIDIAYSSICTFVYAITHTYNESNATE